MPRSQPSTVEKLTGDFLKLTTTEQTVALGVFTAIVKSGVRTAPVRRSAAVSTPAPLAVVGATHSAKAPVRRRRPRRRPEPVAAAETAQFAEVAETEQQ